MLRVVTLLLLMSSTAGAYNEEVHALLTRRALASAGLEGAVTAIDAALPAALRGEIDAYARGHADAAVRAAWVRRFPTVERFDAWAEKELLLLAPAAVVYGIDRVDVKAATGRELLTAGSREPDDDHRNRDRLAYDAARAPLTDGDGRQVPADPALLNMGKLGVLSSQAHAHYGLPAIEMSSDPEVLKTDPRRFALRPGYAPGPILTLADTMAQINLDMALIAALHDAAPPSGSPSATMNALALLHTGQALHYLEDVGNPIHTVQVGLYDFFADAYLAHLAYAARTGGGYLAHLPTFSSIGIDILTNHHALSESYTMKRLVEAEAGAGDERARALLVAADVDDADFGRTLDAALAALGPAPERGEFALTITRALIEASSHEGADVYRVTRAIADPELSRPGVLFDDVHGDPDARVRPSSPATDGAYREFFALQQRSFARVGTAVRRTLVLERRALDEAAPSPEARASLRTAVLDRLVRRQLRMLDEAEARRADYLAHLPASSSPDDHMPGVLAAELALVLVAALACALVVRRARRRP